MSDSNNVFIVFTPLHVLIADAIIRHENLQNIHVLALVDGSEKTKRCCERYFSEATSVMFVPLHRNYRVVATLRLLGRFVASLGNGPVAIHTGSLKSLYTRMLLGMLDKDVSINTFDDGYGSLVLNGYFAEPDTLLKGWLVAAINRRLIYSRLVSSIQRHFTIYDSENVYGRHCRELVRVNIRPKHGKRPMEIAEGKHSEPIRILLTQPVSERLAVSLSEEVGAYNAVIHQYGIAFRLPHPAENIDKGRSISTVTINTELIAEELVCLLSLNGPVELYALGSTALLNLANMENVTSYWLVSPEFNKSAPLGGHFANLHVIELP